MKKILKLTVLILGILTAQHSFAQIKDTLKTINDTTITRKSDTSKVGGINTKTLPLFVIDGVPKTKADVEKMNKSDIKSINVLKDRAATALYGDKGKNGVVLINTKWDVNTNTINSQKTKVDSANQVNTQNLTFLIDGKITPKSEAAKINKDSVERVIIVKEKQHKVFLGINDESDLIIIMTNANKNSAENEELKKKISKINFKTNRISMPPSRDSIPNGYF